MLALPYYFIADAGVTPKREIFFINNYKHTSIPSRFRWLSTEAALLAVATGAIVRDPTDEELLVCGTDPHYVEDSELYQYDSKFNHETGEYESSKIHLSELVSLGTKFTLEEVKQLSVNERKLHAVLVKDFLRDKKGAGKMQGWLDAMVYAATTTPDFKFSINQIRDLWENRQSLTNDDSTEIMPFIGVENYDTIFDAMFRDIEYSRTNNEHHYSCDYEDFFVLAGSVSLCIRRFDQFLDKLEEYAQEEKVCHNLNGTESFMRYVITQLARFKFQSMLGNKYMAHYKDELSYRFLALQLKYIYDGEYFFLINKDISTFSDLYNKVISKHSRQYQFTYSSSLKKSCVFTAADAKMVDSVNKKYRENGSSGNLIEASTINKLKLENLDALLELTTIDLKDIELNNDTITSMTVQQLDKIAEKSTYVRFKTIRQVVDDRLTEEMLGRHLDKFLYDDSAARIIMATGRFRLQNLLQYIE